MDGLSPTRKQETALNPTSKKRKRLEEEIRRAVPTNGEAALSDVLLIRKLEQDIPAIGSRDASPVIISDEQERAALIEERRLGVRWILERREKFGLEIRPALNAVKLMDRFLYKTYRKENVGQIGLLAAGCLTTSLSDEDRRYTLQKAAVTSDLGGGNALSIMEKAIEKELEGELISAMPIVPLAYFLNKLFPGEPSQDGLSVMAMHKIFNTLEAINTIDYLPSIMAVSALLAVGRPSVLSRQELETIVINLDLWKPFEFEIVYSCYTIVVKHVDKKSDSEASVSDDASRR